MALNTVCGIQFAGFGFCVRDLIRAYVHSSGMSVSYHVFCHRTQQAGQTRTQCYNALILKFPSEEVNKVYIPRPDLAFFSALSRHKMLQWQVSIT